MKLAPRRSRSRPPPYFLMKEWTALMNLPTSVAAAVVANAMLPRRLRSKVVPKNPSLLGPHHQVAASHFLMSKPSTRHIGRARTKVTRGTTLGGLATPYLQMTSELGIIIFLC